MNSNFDKPITDKITDAKAFLKKAHDRLIFEALAQRDPVRKRYLITLCLSFDRISGELDDLIILTRQGFSENFTPAEETQ